MMELKDPRPYVFYAHIQWLDESNAGPHLVLQNGPKTRFPAHLAMNSVVVFDVSSQAVRNLKIDEEGISFSARFSGKEFTLFAPLDCMLMLQSANGQVRVPFQALNQEPLPQQENIPQSEKGPLTREVTPEEVRRSVAGKPALSVMSGKSDGIPRGKLSLVPKSAPPPTEPTEPECA